MVAKPWAREPGGEAVLRAGGQVEPRPRRGRLRCPQDRIGEKGEPGCRLALAADIAAAAPELLLMAERIDRDAGPGVIAEAAELKRVDGEAKPRRPRADGGHHGGQPVRQAPGLGRQRHRGKRGKRGPGFACRQQQAGERARDAAAQRGDGGGILAIQRMRQRGAALRLQGLVLQQQRRHRRHCEVEAHLGEADRGQGLGAG